MSQNDYGFASQLLHRAALSTPFITQACFDIERAINNAEDSRLGRHIFVAGLARSGTTILLRALHKTNVFRSLTYRDMPFVLMPNLWGKLSRVFHIYEDEKERAHGDRIQVGFDSPEAFEEVFWRSFCGNAYIKVDCLQPHTVDSETLDLFVEFVSLVLASGSSTETRYLSKNNNNILRLHAIRQAFPNAIILIPFRNPIQQANSLLKQHILFSERHQSDRFSYDYMGWLGHHEFGLTHRPYRFSKNKAVGQSAYAKSNINYWLNTWIKTYSYIYETMPETAILVSYEDLCTGPKELLNKILRISDVTYDVDSLVTEFQAARIAKVEGLDQALTNASLDLYNRMAERARE